MPEKEPIEIPPRGTRGTKMPFEGALMKIAKPFADMQVSRYRRAKDATAPMMMGFPTVLLTTIGARSGSERTHVLGGFADGDEALAGDGFEGRCADPSSLVHQPGQEPGQNLAGSRQPKAQGRREVAERQGAGGRSRADRGSRAPLRCVSEKDRSRDPDHPADARQRLTRATSFYPYQPTTSTMTLADPNALQMSISPDADSCTTTRLGTVCPPTKLRSEASGWLAPCGQTMRSLAAVGLVTVTFRTTALGDMTNAIAGTPPLPAT